MTDEVWSDEKCLIEAQREPHRLEFWRQYHSTEAGAARSVCNNPPRFDKYWERMYPDPERFRIENPEYYYDCTNCNRSHWFVRLLGKWYCPECKQEVHLKRDTDSGEG